MFHRPPSAAAASSSPNLLLPPQKGATSPESHLRSASLVNLPAEENGQAEIEKPPKLQEFSKQSPFGALLSRTLPNYTGPYSVGVRDLEVPIPRQSFGTFRHKRMPHVDAGIVVDTVLFTVFYPCEPQEKPKYVAWFPNRGFIVAAIEHRDGTSPSSTIVAADGATTTLDWIQWSDLDWPELSEQPKDDSVLRREQIKCRVAEIEAVIETMQQISKGEAPNELLKKPDASVWSAWRLVDASRPVLAGHSLGGSAALAVSAKDSYDYRAVVAFDPALQRLLPWESSLPRPILVVNSEEVMEHEFKESFEIFAKTATSDLQVYTISGTTHPSFSDVFLILPDAINKLTGLHCAADVVLERVVRATEEYLSGEGGAGGYVSYDDVLREEEDGADSIEPPAKGKRRHFWRHSSGDQGGKMYKSVGKSAESLA
ncbi:hypothetical protein BN946_scf184940.g58 [Trametes cinnabarina]|uniref:1-alkyl-2-acetylglycerophosphocholine esterase n=1 Tax=Pycnoporus cinnabarinus TaxID=5643 RepID=A0A060SCH9_PYCCI|nr:hypothetical protein BN946_scf184940.g58 [Trametes cinnabarina]